MDNQNQEEKRSSPGIHEPTPVDPGPSGSVLSWDPGTISKKSWPRDLPKSRNERSVDPWSSLNPQRRRTRAAGLTAFREESREDRDEEEDDNGGFSMIAVQRPSEMTCGLTGRGQDSVLSELPNLGNSCVGES